MTVYYNEVDPFAAQWLRNLIAAGYIAPGVVDERSIEDVSPNDIAGFTQCHFFAGIGVWSHALRNAGWSDDRPVWTGSCPCQPFSTAGKGAGFDDERHLWPAWQHLIEQCRPPVIFGEQVASKDAMPWLDLVQDDLEGMGYAFGAVPIASAGFGAPHIRERLYWTAYADHARLEGWEAMRQRANECTVGSDCVVGGLDDTEGLRPGFCNTENIGAPDAQIDFSANASDCEFYGSPGQRFTLVQPGPTNGFWRDADWLLCRDGKWRPVEPGTSPLAPRSANSVGRLRAYGNAITAQVAQAFIEAAL